MSTDLDFLSPANVADPYPALNALREEAPVVWNEPLNAWLVTRYDDVRAAFRDPRLSADRVAPVYRRRMARPGGEAFREMHDLFSRFIVFNDPPAHTRLRKLLEHAFRPRAVARMRGWIESLVDELIEELDGRDRFDFVAAFAHPLPVRVITEMFGVPREARGQITAWSDDIAALLFGGLGIEDREARAGESLVAFADYVREVIADHRARPREDLIGDLIEARHRGDAFNEDEIVATCVLLLFAGHETTRNLLANGMKALLSHPDQLAALARDPALMDTAIEEFLRFDGPSKAMWRLAAERAEYGGCSIEPGHRVLLVQAAANRDPRRFDEPDRLDIARAANRHVGFGYAVHYCLGAAVARLEGSIGLGHLLRRFPDIRLDGEGDAYLPLVISRALARLPVAV